MQRIWKSLLLKQLHEKPIQNGWYETSTDDFATSVRLYWCDFEWGVAPDSPAGKEHIAQNRQWRSAPSAS